MPFADGAGNPLYLTELVDALARGSSLTISERGAAGLSGGAPESLPATMADRLGFMQPWSQGSAGHGPAGCGLRVRRRSGARPGLWT